MIERYLLPENEKNHEVTNNTERVFKSEKIIIKEKVWYKMNKSDFYYDLPEELIAQDPLKQRDMSRLMTLDRKTGKTGNYIFHDIVKFLNPGECLILNDSRVLPARLYGVK